jgi:hypothetical protein
MWHLVSLEWIFTLLKKILGIIMPGFFNFFSTNTMSNLSKATDFGLSLLSQNHSLNGNDFVDNTEQLKNTAIFAFIIVVIIGATYCSIKCRRTHHDNDEIPEYERMPAPR